MVPTRPHGSNETFLPGLATGSSAVTTGSQVVDGGADLAVNVLQFFGRYLFGRYRAEEPDGASPGLGVRTRRYRGAMELDLTRHVAADPDTVWAVLTDIPEAHRTLGGVLAVEILTSGPYQPGLRWRETRKMFGMKSTEEMMVLTAEPPHSTTIVAESGGTEYKTVFTITPDADGGSTLRMRFGAHTAHAPAVSRVVVSVMGRFAEKSTRRTMEQDLADIAAEAERRAGGTPPASGR